MWLVVDPTLRYLAGSYHIGVSILCNVALLHVNINRYVCLIFVRSDTRSSTRSTLPKLFIEQIIVDTFCELFLEPLFRASIHYPAKSYRSIWRALQQSVNIGILFPQEEEPTILFTHNGLLEDFFDHWRIFSRGEIFRCIVLDVTIFVENQKTKILHLHYQL